MSFVVLEVDLEEEGELDTLLHKYIEEHFDALEVQLEVLEVLRLDRLVGFVVLVVAMLVALLIDMNIAIALMIIALISIMLVILFIATCIVIM